MFMTYDMIGIRLMNNGLCLWLMDYAYGLWSYDLQLLFHSLCLWIMHYEMTIE